MIAADPYQGGATWAVLQYVLGLRELGHDVFLIEPVPEDSLRPRGAALAESHNATYFRQVVRDYALANHSALMLAGGTETIGLPYSELVKIADHTDVLINVSGMLTDESLIADIPRRVYLDLDPAFNQLWADEYGIDMRFAAHNRFVTIGRNIGDPGCDVPTCGIDWIKAHQPVVLSQWPVADEVERDAFTTVGNWRAYGSAERGGVFYGQKAHSLREFIDLPKRSRDRFSLALSIYPGDEKDISALRANDWELLDPQAVAGAPASYQNFVRGSKAEIGVAKSGYVKSQCGWFSDRSVCYLASGRPVIAQETAFSRDLPVGEGLFSFRDGGDVVSAADAIRTDYRRHARTARNIAEEYFDSAKVLPTLLVNIS